MSCSCDSSCLGIVHVLHLYCFFYQCRKFIPVESDQYQWYITFTSVQRLRNIHCQTCFLVQPINNVSVSTSGNSESLFSHFLRFVYHNDVKPHSSSENNILSQKFHCLMLSALEHNQFYHMLLSCKTSLELETMVFNS